LGVGPVASVFANSSMPDIDMAEGDISSHTGCMQEQTSQMDAYQQEQKQSCDKGSSDCCEGMLCVMSTCGGAMPAISTNFSIGPDNRHFDTSQTESFTRPSKSISQQYRPPRV